MNPLTEFHRRLLYLVYGTLAATGAAWAALHYFPGALGVPGEAARSANVWLMKIHGAFAMLALVLLGTLLTRHVNWGLRAGLNTASGTGLLSGAALLIGTGWLLYYAGSEGVRDASSLVHLAVGLVLPVLLIVHLARRFTARATQASGVSR